MEDKGSTMKRPFPSAMFLLPLPLIDVGIVVIWHLQGIPPYLSSWLSSVNPSLSILHCSRRLTRILLCSDLFRRSKSETQKILFRIRLFRLSTVPPLVLGMTFTNLHVSRRSLLQRQAERSRRYFILHCTTVRAQTDLIPDFLQDGI
jgi:hypothetical protein